MKQPSSFGRSGKVSTKERLARIFKHNVASINQGRKNRLPLNCCALNPKFTRAPWRGFSRGLLVNQAQLPLEDGDHQLVVEPDSRVLTQYGKSFLRNAGGDGEIGLLSLFTHLVTPPSRSVIPVTGSGAGIKTVTFTLKFPGQNSRVKRPWGFLSWRPIHVFHDTVPHLLQ